MACLPFESSTHCADSTVACLRSFHGIFPSKSKQERQIEKDAETAAAKRAATSENPASLHRLQAAQKMAAAPYVVLSGSVRLLCSLRV